MNLLPRSCSLIALASAVACSASSDNGGSTVRRPAEETPPNLIGGENPGGSGGSGGEFIPGDDLPLGGSNGIVSCPGGVKTTLSGRVFDPAGRVPLYNAVVYVPVPGTALPPIVEGASCDNCSGMQASALAVALSDAAGRFVLEDVPAGSNVPLVVQAGKWRRAVTIPSVTACQENALTDPNLTRLPRNQSEGHLPKLALVTGHADALECLLRKIGVDDSEFTTDSGNGRVHMFYGCPQDEDDGLRYGANTLSPELGGGSFSRAATTLYADPAKLGSYDMVILSCEGHGCDEEKDPYVGNLVDYADKGGRIFFDHMHFRWFTRNLPEGDNPWEGAGQFDTGDDFPPNTNFNVDTSFPKGNALADWLVNVGASGARGQLTIAEAQYSAQEAIPPMAQRWVYGDSPPAVQFMTMNTPVQTPESPAADQCGRVVHTDLHVSTASSSDQGTPFPLGCDSGAPSAEEMTLEFIFFDLSSCVQKEDLPPVPPTIIR
jgi:hypothetical protein